MVAAQLDVAALERQGSSLNPQSLSSIRLWCAFSFTSKHSPPKVLIVELRTTMPLLVSFAYRGWSVDFGLVPM